jgi:hypothetical protein
MHSMVNSCQANRRLLPACLSLVPRFGRASGLLPMVLLLASFAPGAVGGPNIGGVNTNRFIDADLAHAAKVRPIDTNTLAVGLVTLRMQERTLTLPAKVNMVDQIIEYALVTSDGKRHESLLTTEAQPRDLHVAALLLGLKPASLRETQGALKIPATAQVEVEVIWPIHGGVRRVPLHQLVGQLKNSEPGTAREVQALEAGSWLYSGSEATPGRFEAQAQGSFISLISDPAALINNPRPSRLNDKLHVPNKSQLPPLGTSVQVVIRVVAPKPAEAGAPVLPKNP